MATSGSKEKHTLTFLWRIENIGVFWDSHFGCNIESPEFGARTFEGKRLKLDMWPNMDDEFIRLYLRLCDDPLDFPIDCEWSFIGSNRLPVISGIVRNHIFFGSKSLSLPDCPTREEIFVTKRSTFLLQGDLTVRCRIWKSRGNLSNNEFTTGQTRFAVVENSFLWPVTEFNSLPLNREVTTPVKFEFSNKPSDFVLELSLNGLSLEDANVNVELIPISIPGAIAVFMEMFVLESKQGGIEGIVKIFFSWSRESWILPQFLSRKELIRKKSDCLRGDILNLRCQFIAINLSPDSSIQKKYYGCSHPEVDSSNDSSTFLDASCQTLEKSFEPPNISIHREDPLNHLGEDLLGLYTEQKLTDFELLVGEISFPVHKNILSARSPVFKAMFNSDMKESNSKSQYIQDLDVHTLNRLLTFLYGGSMEPQLQWESAAKLYYAADKYQVQSLKHECSSILRSNISVWNGSDILRLADRHQDQELVSFVYEFILTNYDEVMQSAEWEKFLETDSYLAGKAMHQIYKKKLLTKSS